MRAPAWIFLPCPLEPYLVAEQHFQTSRRDNPRAVRKRINRRSVLFQPYRIREGFLQDQSWAPRKWHGDPVLAILRSYVILLGLPRLALDKGGLPEAVAEMYSSLIGLYGTPYRDPTVLDTITLEPVASAVAATGMMGPPARRGTSDNDSVTTSGVTVDGGASRAGTPTIWPMLQPRGKCNKRLAEAESVSEIASEAPSDQTGRSNDTQQTRTVPKMRAAKRPRLGGNASASGASSWIQAIPERRGQLKDK